MPKRRLVNFVPHIWPQKKKESPEMYRYGLGDAQNSVGQFCATYLAPEKCVFLRNFDLESSNFENSQKESGRTKI